MKSIKERVLEESGIIVVKMHMDEFAWSVFKPVVGSTYRTEHDIKVQVIESSYYPDSEFGIIRIRRV